MNVTVTRWDAGELVRGATSRLSTTSTVEQRREHFASPPIRPPQKPGPRRGGGGGGGPRRWQVRLRQALLLGYVLCVACAIVARLERAKHT